MLMATIIEKVVAGEDAQASMQEFVDAQVEADKTTPNLEYLELREKRAYEEAVANLKTNALIYHQPGETIGVRAVVVTDEEAEQVEGGVREVSAAELAEAINSTNLNEVVRDEGKSEAKVDSGKSPGVNPPAQASTSPQGSSSVAGSGVGNNSNNFSD
jgi:hypothetical protein